MTAKIKKSSNLGFRGALAVSDAVMGQFSSSNAEVYPVRVEEKSVRGTISNRLPQNKLETEAIKANFQTVDNAMLDHDKDWLTVSFSVKALEKPYIPDTVNEPAHLESIIEKVGSYVAEHGYQELAHRYATNIANARFLWRNLLSAEEVFVDVTVGEEIRTFNAFDYSMYDFCKNDEDLAWLAGIIDAGFKGEHKKAINVVCRANVGHGQQVFPSQEMITNTEKGDKSKVLYVRNGQAAMHSQKIGNALRTIDTWHEGVESVGPLAVEPYASVPSKGKAYRTGKNHFYAHFDDWTANNKEITLEQKHFVVAMLIRGGVFGESGKNSEGK